MDVGAGEQTLPIFLQMYDQTAYRPHSLLLYGTQPENADLEPQQAELAGRWNERNAYPHLQYSGFSEAMAEIERESGDSIPTVRGDGGPYWEDGIASDAYYAALERSTEARGVSAEKLATAASVMNPRVSGDPAALAEMWRNVALADEHTFDSHDGVGDPGSDHSRDELAVKESFALRAHDTAVSVLRTSMADLADVIPAPTKRLVVFNPLNWSRDGLVRFDLQHGEDIVDPKNGEVVAVRVLDAGTVHRAVEFLARGVPAVGYKVYELRDRGKEPEKSPAIDGTVLENKYYRIELDRASGAVDSLFDKELHRELVDKASPYRFGQYLYVTGGDTPASNALIQFESANPSPDLTVHGSDAGRIVSISRTPDGVMALLESSALNTPKVDLEVRLFDGEKKVEFTANLTKTETFQKEGAYFAFPFAIDHPRFLFEVQNGWIDPAKDMLPGAGKEWFSVQHWICTEGDGIAAAVMPLDAGLATLGDINRGSWPEQFGDRKGSVFSYVMNNYWPTNYRAGQGGAFCFRYVVTSALRPNPAELSRLGWEEMTPLETDEIQSEDKSWSRPPGLDPREDSFLSVDDPALLLETWKPAENGAGTILRLLDLGGPARTVAIRTPWQNLSKVRITDAMERDRRDLPLSGPHSFEVQVFPHQIVTIRIIGSSVLQSPTLTGSGGSSAVPPQASPVEGIQMMPGHGSPGFMPPQAGKASRWTSRRARPATRGWQGLRSRPAPHPNEASSRRGLEGLTSLAPRYQCGRTSPLAAAQAAKASGHCAESSPFLPMPNPCPPCS
jgi:alpha-mannosidase